MDTLLRRREMMVAVNSAPSPVFHSKLVFDGTAYIDTDVLLPENGSIRLTVGWETQKITQHIFNASGIVGAYINNSHTETMRYFTALYGSSSAVVSGTNIGLAWTNESYGLFLTPKRFGYGTQYRTFTKGASTPSGGLIFGASGTHAASRFTGAISGIVRIYGSDAQNATDFTDLGNYTPVYTLRPCTYLGEPGLWCPQTSKFFGNSAGSGTLSVAD